MCSRLGRGYPDISAQALDYEVVVNGEILYVDGTSCAVTVCLSLFHAAFALRRRYSSTQLTANVQTVAAMISLMNDIAAADDRHPFGCLNYWLYSKGLMYRRIKDVKFGSNPGCGEIGFIAAPGWDLVRPAPLLSFPSQFRCWLIWHLYKATGLGTLDFDEILDSFLYEWGTI